MLLGLEAEGLVSGVRCRYAAVQLPLSHNHTHRHSTYRAHTPRSTLYARENSWCVHAFGDYLTIIFLLFYLHLFVVHHFASVLVSSLTL